jgi:hypothetical protein
LVDEFHIVSDNVDEFHLAPRPKNLQDTEMNVAQEDSSDSMSDSATSYNKVISEVISDDESREDDTYDEIEMDPESEIHMAEEMVEGFKPEDNQPESEATTMVKQPEEN